MCVLRRECILRGKSFETWFVEFVKGNNQIAPRVKAVLSTLAVVLFKTAKC